MKTVKVFAPASSANIGPGFDILGLALTGYGDTVEARQIDSPEVIIEAIFGDEGRLPLAATKNTAGVAAIEALKIVGAKHGVALTLHKGLPLGSGLGSSAASGAAAAWAVALLNNFDDKKALMPACLAGEESVSGHHADNAAPSLLGGLVLIQGYHPLRFTILPTPKKLRMVLVTPTYEVETAQARTVVPQLVPLKNVIANNSNLSSMVAATFRDDARAFGQAAVDNIVEPARSSLIPGFKAVKQAALQAGAYGCSISGSGPTLFAICDCDEAGQKIGLAMQNAFKAVDLESTINVAKVDVEGARAVA